jgi:hypothetical protein
VSTPRTGHFEWVIARWPETDRHTDGRRKLEVKPQRMFKAAAIMVWGATEKTVLHQIEVAGEPELVGPILLRAYFKATIPFQDFEALLISRPDDHPCLPSLDKLGPYGDIYLTTLSLGTSFEVDVEGPFDHAVFIGKGPRYMTVNQLIREGIHRRGCA